MNELKTIAICMVIGFAIVFVTPISIVKSFLNFIGGPIGFIIGCIVIGFILGIIMAFNKKE